VVVIFFRLAYKWSKWCTQTLHPYSQIFNFFRPFEHQLKHHLATILKTVQYTGKGFSSAKKRCKPHLSQPTNADAISSGSNSTTHQSGRRPTAFFLSKKQSHFILSRRRASIDFHILQDDRGGPCHHFTNKLFWVPSTV